VSQQRAASKACAPSRDAPTPQESQHCFQETVPARQHARDEFSCKLCRVTVVTSRTLECTCMHGFSPALTAMVEFHQRRALRLPGCSCNKGHVCLISPAAQAAHTAHIAGYMQRMLHTSGAQLRRHKQRMTARSQMNSHAHSQTRIPIHASARQVPQHFIARWDPQG
jgi:hypothetical protein